jgi:hypothetical protein
MENSENAPFFVVEVCDLGRSLALFFRRGKGRVEATDDHDVFGRSLYFPLSCPKEERVGVRRPLRKCDKSDARFERVDDVLRRRAFGYKRRRLLTLNPSPRLARRGRPTRKPSKLIKRSDAHSFSQGSFTSTKTE